MPSRAFNTGKVFSKKLPIDGTMIYHCVLHDRGLDSFAKLLHTFMRIYPSEWHYNAVDLATRLGVSRRTVDRALARLETAGYLDRSAARGEDGVFMGYVYTLYPVKRRLYLKLLKQVEQEEKEEQGC